MPLASDCISRAQLRELAVAALQAADTLAGQAVYTAKNFPAKPDKFPMLVVQSPIEHKDGLVRGVPQFNTVVTLAVNARIGGTSAQVMETQLDLLCTQVEAALLCSHDFMAPVQQVVSVDTQFGVFAEGEVLVGEAQVVLGCEVFQLYEPGPGIPLAEIGLIIDMNGDGVPDVLAAAVPDAAITSDGTGAPISGETSGEIPIAIDNPPVPFHPLTGAPAGS
jgi:hypothetical protein